MKKKKWLSFASALAVLGSICAAPLQVSAAEQTLADNVSDDDFESIVAIHTFLLGISTGTEAVDINEDGRINAVDLTLAKRELLGSGAPALTNFASDTFDIYLDEEKTVTFTVQAENIADPAAFAVMLYDEADNAVAEMLDDGTNGDVTANDGIYTAETVLSSDTAKNTGYYAAGGELRSEPFEICFYRDLEEDEITKFFTLYSKISEMTFEEAAEFVAASDEIASYSVNTECRQIYFQSIYGMQGCYEDVPETAEQTKGTGELAIPDSSGRDFSAAATAAASTTFTPAHPGKRDVIVLRSFRSTEFQYDDFKDAGEILANALNGSLTVVDDTDVDLEQLRNLASYGTVMIDSHGTLKDSKTPFIVTGVSLDADRFENSALYQLFHQEYSADYYSGRIYCYTNSSGLHRVAVGKEFFDKYYDTGSLNDSFWYLGTCDSLYDNTLSDILISKGAGAVVGYTDTVGTGYCNDTLFESVINSMLLSGSNVRIGVSEAKRIYGNTDPGNTKCEFKYKGKRNYKLVDTIDGTSVSGNTYQYKGHFYRVFHDQVNWSEAKALCEKEGGHLASVTSEGEEQFIEQIISYYNKSDIYWLGATDEKKEGQWEWLTGEKFSYNHWSSSNPDNFNHGVHGYENYLGIVGKHYGFADAFEWNDFSDTTNDGCNSFDTGFICEWE